MTHRFADNALIDCATLLGNPDYYLKCLQKEKNYVMIILFILIGSTCACTSQYGSVPHHVKCIIII